MNIVEIVRRMERAGVTIQRNEGKLQVRADTPLTDQQRTFIQAYKEEMIHYLNVMDDPHVQSIITFFDAKVQKIDSSTVLVESGEADMIR